MIHSNTDISQNPILLFYFNDIQNLGDILNEYILKHIFGEQVLKATSKKAEVVCIGSLLESYLMKKNKPWQHFSFKKPVKVWGTGFIAAENQFPNRYEKLNRKLEIYAVRGKLTQQRLVGLTRQKIENIALGDPGILASRLMNNQQSIKKYRVGFIRHYIDQHQDCIKNIEVDGIKIINILGNPLDILREIAECEVILSSAMHGLVVSDSFCIPNQWIKCSDNIFGNDYKFNDYYSVFDIPQPKYIDLRYQKITEKDIEDIKQNYAITENVVLQIQENLIDSFKKLQIGLKKEFNQE